MAVITYKRLALDWQPSGKSEREFHLITAVTLCLLLLVAVALTLIPVPEVERRERAPVPDRIAKFLSQREKPPAPVVVPKPKPEPKILPKQEPKPVVERKRPSELVETKPLTETQQRARATAEQSGLLALASELNDLMDTSDVNAMVAGNLAREAVGSDVVTGHDANVITAGVAQGGGGVDSGRYGTVASDTQLTAREVVAANSGLFADEKSDLNKTQTGKSRARSGNGRSEEDVTIVFDRNKGSLYSLYERERRKSPGLQGKIVLQITISPQGIVTQVKIISSELNNPALEARLVSRIKQFKFEPNNVDPVTVTYPIEFLPS